MSFLASKHDNLEGVVFDVEKAGGLLTPAKIFYIVFISKHGKISLPTFGSMDIIEWPHYGRGDFRFNLTEDLMADNMFLQMDLDKIKERADSLRIAYDLIAVTLCNGDILLGALAKHWRWDGQKITLSFNTEEGKRFGHSHAVDIPTRMIADIQLIPLDVDSIPRMAQDDPQLEFFRETGLAEVVGQTEEEISRLQVQDYPNPLARIICEHNIRIISEQQLSLHGMVEKALSQDAIPPEGIYLKEDYLLYADWEFFGRQMSGGLSVGGELSTVVASINVAKDLSPSLNDFLLSKLRASLLERLRKSAAPQINPDELVQGCILVPDPPDDTEIEGDKCIVALCIISEEEDDRVAYPVLLKLSKLKYPLELLGRINSVLTFYGEHLPVPLNLMGRSYNTTMLVRAIAYLGPN